MSSAVQPAVAPRAIVSGQSPACNGPIVAADGVSDEQLQAWALTRAQFEAYNAAAFEAEKVPEAPPPISLA